MNKFIRVVPIIFMLAGCNSGGLVNNGSNINGISKLSKESNLPQYQLVETVPNGVNIPLAPTAVDSAQEIGDLLSSAKEKIDIEAYYFDDQPQSEFNRKIMQTLEKKAQDGVAIRIIIEAKMYNNSLIQLGRLLSYPNVHIVKNSYFNSINGIVHAKLIIVDDNSFFIGSQNLDWIAFSLNHEVGVVLNDKNLAIQLEQVFNEDFNQNPIYEKNPPDLIVPAKATGDSFIATSPNFPGIPSEIDNIVKLINHAESTIEIQAMQIENYDSYSKSYWYQLQNALINAASRKVNVHVMMSNWEFEPWNTDYNNAFLSELIKTPNISVRYSTFPQLQGTELCVPYSKVDHAKFMIVDGKDSWIGTGNLSQNYFTASRDFSVFMLNNPIFAHELSSAFVNVWNSGYISSYYSLVVTVITPSICTQ